MKHRTLFTTFVRAVAAQVAILSLGACAGPAGHRASTALVSPLSDAPTWRAPAVPAPRGFAAHPILGHFVYVDLVSDADAPADLSTGSAALMVVNASQASVRRVAVAPRCDGAPMPMTSPWVLDLVAPDTLEPGTERLVVSPVPAGLPFCGGFVTFEVAVEPDGQGPYSRIVALHGTTQHCGTQPARGTLLVATGEMLTVGDDCAIGRAHGDLMVYEPSVSRRHARFADDGAGFVLEDLGSTNGIATYGIGRAVLRLTEPVTFFLGDVGFRFVPELPSAEDAARYGVSRQLFQAQGDVR